MSRKTDGDRIAEALRDCFTSPNVLDYNLEPANPVDAIARLVDAVNRLAKAIESITQKEANQ